MIDLRVYAAFEMADRANVGITLDAEDAAALFGEDQGRYLIACDPVAAEALAEAADAAGVSLHVAGRFGGEEVRLGSTSAKLAELSDLYRNSFARAVA